MISLSDAAFIKCAVKLRLEPRLHRLIRRRVEGLRSRFGGDLLDRTHILVVQAGDSESDIRSEVGFSPLESPFDQARYGTAGFDPFWDWLKRHDGWFEMIVTVGDGGFAYVLLIEDDVRIPENLLRLCREWAT